DGQIDSRMPVTAYWIKDAVDGHREELTPFERSKAYGFTVEPAQDGNSFRMRLAAQKKREISIVRQGDAIRAEALIDGHQARLKRMFVSAHKVLPTVRYIEFF